MPSTRIKTENPPGEVTRIASDIDRLTLGAWALEPGGVPEMPEPPAFRRIVVALDESAASRHAATWARHIAKAHGARTWLAHVIPPSNLLDYFVDKLGLELPSAASEVVHEEEIAAQEILDHAARRFQTESLPVEKVMVEGAPATQIARLAADEHADLVVLGSHGESVASRMLLGSVAAAVKDQVEASVLLARTAPPPARILLPVDGSTASKRAAMVGLRLAQALDAPTHLLFVVQTPLESIPRDALERAYTAAAAQVDLSWARPSATASVAYGSPGEVIPQVAAEKGCGLIVLGSRGLSGIPSLMAGSVSRRVAHLTKASVLLVR